MIDITMSVSFGGRRDILAVFRNEVRRDWYLIWGRPTTAGHRFEKPLETGFKTKKAAMARRKEVLHGA